MTYWTSAPAGFRRSGRASTPSPPTSCEREHDAQRKGETIPYRRRFVVIAAGQAGRSRASPAYTCRRSKSDTSPFLQEVRPGHPDADKDGYVQYPNVDPTVEFVNALEASRAYEANVTMMEVTKAMINASLRLIA